MRVRFALDAYPGARAEDLWAQNITGKAQIDLLLPGNRRFIFEVDIPEIAGTAVDVTGAVVEEKP